MDSHAQPQPLSMDEKNQHRLRDILDGHSKDLYLEAASEYFHKRDTREGLLLLLTAFNRISPRLIKENPGRLIFRVSWHVLDMWPNLLELTNLCVQCPALTHITLFITRTATTVSVRNVEQIRKYDIQNNPEDRHALVVWLWTKMESTARRIAKHQRVKIKIRTRAASRNPTSTSQVSPSTDAEERRRKQMYLQPPVAASTLVPTPSVPHSSTFPHRPFKPSPLGLSSPNIQIDSMPRLTDKTESAIDGNAMEGIKMAAVEAVPEQRTVGDVTDRRRMAIIPG